MDPAHGENVKGKCSPDGVHKEYLWSRQQCNLLSQLLQSEGYEVHLTTTALKEPGLSKRKLEANEIPTKNVKLLISLHNNAAGSDSKWYKATGTEIFTSKGRTQSDIFSSIMYTQFKRDFPTMKLRYGGVDPMDNDKDENFTVLMGNYNAMLIEWLFQDSKDDIELLLNPKVNIDLCESILKGINEINDYVYSKLKH